MTIYFVSRHRGAVEWAKENGLSVDQFVDHLDPEIIQQEDVVIGPLPTNLAAQVCRRGGRYLHLSLELPREWRGRELTAQDMANFGARLEEYYIIQHGVGSS
ncbi:CRISPR-associated protein Csx16 [Gammaproteobacteria bacterium]